MLPRIASLLGTTTDELIGWEPQMGEEGLAAFQGHLAALAAEDKGRALAYAETELSDHASCWSLLLLVASNLMVWACGDGATEGDAQAWRARAAELVERVLDRAEGPRELALARRQRASLHIAEGDLDSAEALLAPMAEESPCGPDALTLARLRASRGKREEALKATQRCVLGAAASLFAALQQEIGMREAPENVVAVADAAEGAMRALGWNAVQPGGAAPSRLAAADALLELGEGEAALGQLERALDALEAARAAGREAPVALDKVAAAHADGLARLTGTQTADMLAGAAAALAADERWPEGLAPDLVGIRERASSLEAR